PFLTVGIDAGQLRQQLVRPHSDQRTDRLRPDLETRLAERIRPRLRVRVVAVEQRAVDVQEYGLDHAIAGVIDRTAVVRAAGHRPLRFVCPSTTTSPAFTRPS